MPGELQRKCDAKSGPDKEGIQISWTKEDGVCTIMAECRMAVKKEKADHVLKRSQESYPNFRYGSELCPDGSCDIHCSVNVSGMAPLSLMQAAISSLKGAVILCKRELEEGKEYQL